MTRNEFIRLCTVFGIGLPLHLNYSSCQADNLESTDFTGKVLIIGAGAGGLSAGYFLSQLGIDFEILEASSNYGGRMKRNIGFANFPIPLGAEWIHTDANVLQRIANDDNVSVGISTVGYNENDTVGLWDGEMLSVSKERDSDLKFVNSTWFDFYEQYIVPPIKDKIRYETVVTQVDYNENEITVLTNNSSFTCDKLIVSVPPKILQEGDIIFNPNLPERKRNAIDQLNVWAGFKAFFEFSEKFYHTATAFDIRPETDGQKLYYDASYGQDTTQHILGLFTVGKPALELGSKSEVELRNFVLQELDTIYDNQASQTYLKHMVQNWNDEPYIRGGYISDHEDWRTVAILSEPVDDKIYFAGGPYTNGEDWVAVHAAAQSARDAVHMLSR